MPQIAESDARGGRPPGDEPEKTPGTASSPARRVLRWLWGLVKYGQVGIVSATTDFGLYGVLTFLGVPPLVGNCISRPTGGVVCFVLNKYWTFGNRGRKPPEVQFIRFWCIFGVSLLLSQSFLWTFHRLIGLDGYTSKLAAESVVFFFNFLALKYWTFR